MANNQVTGEYGPPRNPLAYAQISVCRGQGIRKQRIGGHYWPGSILQHPWRAFHPNGL